MEPVIKPVITYKNIEDFRNYLDRFIKDFPDVEDLILLDYEKADSRVVNDIELFLAPGLSKPGPGSIIGGIQTNISTNLDIEWFAKSTGLEDKTIGEVLITETKDPDLVLLYNFYEGGNPPLYLTSENLRKSIRKSEFDVNKVIGDLFNFYGINSYTEKEFIFDFQKMKRIREEDFDP